MPRRTPYVDSDFFGMPKGTKAKPLGGGRNSQVFLLDIPDREPMVFKRYFVDPRDKRDRQGTEARALKFLEAMDVRQAPLLLTLDTDRQASMLSYVPGEKVTAPTVEHVDQTARFLARLVELSATEEAREAGFSPASEAFFSAAGVVENIERRLARFDAVDESCPLCRELSDFLGGQLRPALARHAATCADTLAAMGQSMDEEIPESWRILSPSDFGLHNAVLRPDGGLSFFDYEYFGWDDPSKTLADFRLHPGMTLADTMHRRFLAGVLPALRATGYDPHRAVALFPLFGIKWCCILLNEFVPRDLARRAFAGSDRTEAHERVLARQLGKARDMLDTLDRNLDTFSRHLAAIP